MAQHSIFGGELRPDQQRYARMMGGMSSPLWLPFMAAASVGATWWMMQNWTRLATGARDGAEGAAAKPAGNGQSASSRDLASEGTGHAHPAQGQPAQAQPAQAMGAQARSFAREVSAPVTEAVAVQGANDAETRSEPAARKEAAPAPAKPAAAPKTAAEPKASEGRTAEAKAAPAPKAPAKAEAAPQPAARAKAAAPSATAARNDPAVDRLLAAAAASHPEPELPPHEGLPARKKGGGKNKKNGG